MKKSVAERELLIIQRLARRAINGYKVPQEFIDFAASFGQFIVTGNKTMKDAETLAKMRRSDEYGGSDITQYLKEKPINTGFAMAIHRHIEGKYKQSDTAKHPRPKKNPTIRKLTIESMRSCRADYHTLNDFIESAKNDSVKGLELEETEKDNKRVFELKWESLPEKEDKDVKLTSYSTLEKWWAAALKKPM